MSNWIDKLAQLPHHQDGSLISGAVEPVLRPEASRAGIWYETPYDFLPDFDLLWVCQTASVAKDLSLYAFTPDQAMSAPSSPPHITITLPDTGPADGNPHRVNCFGFAPNGDMWVGFSDTSPTTPHHGQYVAKIPASKLLASGAVTPDWSFPVVDAAVSSVAISAIVVAPNGDLWVSTVASTDAPSGILKYSAASIAAPGAPSPAVVLHQAGISNSANDILLDGAGNLWFTNGLAHTVNRLSASQLLTSSAAIVPDVILSFPAVTYSGLAIDVAGNLWCGRGTVAGTDMYAVADIQASGTPTPARTLSTVSSVAQGKLRFDKSGDLWLQTAQGPMGVPPSKITTSGSPTPNAMLTGGGVFSSARVLNFNPASFD
jgi:hypothetical protein